MQNRRDLFRLASLSCITGAALPLLAGNSHILSDSLIDASQATLTRAAFGDTRIFFQGPTEQLKSMTAGSLILNAGMEPHPPHQHPEEEIMLVTEGTGEILVDNKTHQVGPGSMMYSAGQKLNGIKNTGTTPMVF